MDRNPGDGRRIPLVTAVLGLIAAALGVYTAIHGISSGNGDHGPSTSVTTVISTTTSTTTASADSSSSSSGAAGSASTAGTTSAAGGANVWHRVSLAKLLHPDALEPSNYTKTKNIGATLFRYSWTGFVDDSADNAGAAPEIDNVLNVDATTCRSITFSGGAEQEDSSEPHVGPELDVFREGMTEIRSQLPFDSVTSLRTIRLPMDRSFYVRVRTGYNGTDNEGNAVWLDGSASCSTPTGRAS